MSSVEAAASLFGLEGDAGPDPFAVIGNEDTDTTQATGSNIEQQLAEHAQCDTSSCLVDMGQDASSLFAEQMYPDAQASGHDAWSLPPSQDSNAQVNGTHGPYVQQQSWYSDVHSTGYEPRSSHTSQPVRSAFTSDHDPYRPSPEGHRQPSSAPSYAQAQPPYDPYKPSTTTAYTHHTPVVSGAQITRESYKPISRSVSSPYAPTSVAPPLALPPQPVAEGNTPPAATTAASYRPKTSNAYDPPLPPPRVAKRAVSARTPRSASPATGHQTHGQTAAPPVPPLPPTVTIARNGSSSTPVGLPPRPASQQQVVDLHRRAENYGPMPYQNGITYVPPSVKESGPLPREPPVSRQVPPDTYSDNVIEDSLRHVSNDSLSCNTLETNGVSQDHDVFGEQLESQTVYTSDDMPWRDPEDGGLRERFPSIRRSFVEHLAGCTSQVLAAPLPVITLPISLPIILMLAPENQVWCLLGRAQVISFRVLARYLSRLILGDYLIVKVLASTMDEHLPARILRMLELLQAAPVSRLCAAQ
ncbi:hypothetical protein EDD16DRAFT_495133 [Pisolithus croceorrhizus]|nr:hypothetical protein EDD16DRAFT_495133 [Pisolithus croceorrhizus]